MMKQSFVAMKSKRLMSGFLLLTLGLLNGGSAVELPVVPSANEDHLRQGEGSEVTDQFFVSVDGSDQHPGTREKPFATLHRAQRAVRERIAQGLTKPVTVSVRAGVYYLEQPLLLTPEDSGTRLFPVTWKAADGERVVLRGGKLIEGFVEYRDGIYVADLAKQGVKDLFIYQLFHLGSGVDQPPVRQPMARYPNVDPEHPRTGGYMLVSKGYEELVKTSDEATALTTFAYQGTPEADRLFASLKDTKQLEVFSLVGGGWRHRLSPVRSINASRRLIRGYESHLRYERHNLFYLMNSLDLLDSPGEWHVDREAGLLYFYPPDNHPPDGRVLLPVADAVIELKGSLPYPYKFLEFRYRGTRGQAPSDGAPDNPVQHVHIRGFIIEGARHDGIRLSGARDCRIEACGVSHVGNIGINVGGAYSKVWSVGIPRRNEEGERYLHNVLHPDILKSQKPHATLKHKSGPDIGAGGAGQCYTTIGVGKNILVFGCDVYDTLADGIMILGDNNLAENNHVWDVAKWVKDAPGINVMGYNSTVRRNTIHDLPRLAVFWKGDAITIELNDVFNLCLETRDMGAIRAVHRNLNIGFGDMIRWNRIHHVPGYGFVVCGSRGLHPGYHSPYYSFGIYLDDYTSHTTVYGNIISGVHRAGVMIHGGGHVTVQNNIIVNTAEGQVEVAPINHRRHFTPHPRYKDAAAGTRIQRNILVTTGDQPVYAHRDDNVGDHKVQYANNLVHPAGTNPFVQIKGQDTRTPWNQWRSMGHDKGSVIADALFKDLEGGDYTLREHSPAFKLGFEPIPVDQIGCYPHHARAVWPLRPSNMPQEKPILYRLKVTEP